MSTSISCRVHRGSRDPRPVPTPLLASPAFDMPPRLGLTYGDGELSLLGLGPQKELVQLAGQQRRSSRAEGGREGPPEMAWGIRREPTN